MLLRVPNLTLSNTLKVSGSAEIYEKHQCELSNENNLVLRQTYLLSEDAGKEFVTDVIIMSLKSFRHSARHVYSMKQPNHLKK